MKIQEFERARHARPRLNNLWSTNCFVRVSIYSILVDDQTGIPQETKNAHRLALEILWRGLRENLVILTMAMSDVSHPLDLLVFSYRSQSRPGAGPNVWPEY